MRYEIFLLLRPMNLLSISFRQEIMRMILGIALLFVAGFFIVAASKDRNNYPRFFKHRTKLREIRGFKPEYISTAIGFGKREDPMERTPDFPEWKRILLSFMKKYSRIKSAEILKMMLTNPELAVTMDDAK